VRAETVVASISLSESGVLVFTGVATDEIATIRSKQRRPPFQTDEIRVNDRIEVRHNMIMPIAIQPAE